jgi:DNA-binding transcriptional MerR regulator
MSERLWYKIGEAADCAGVSPREIRYWEKVIPEIHPRRSTGNQRYYHRDDLPKLRSIAAWIKNGYSVEDCGELLLKGSITRDLGLDTGDTGKCDFAKTSGTADTNDLYAGSPKAVPHVTTTEITHTKTSCSQNEMLKSQLEEIIVSLKRILSRLKKPALR